MTFRSLLLVSAIFGALTGALPFHAARGNTTELPIKVLEGSSPDVNALTVQQSAEVLYLIHSRLGPEGTPALVADDVAAADAFWTDTVAKATGGWIGGAARIQGYAPKSIFNATSVGIWFATYGRGFPNDFLETSPTHYLSYSGAGTSDPTAAVETIESWGQGPTTFFKGFPEAKPDFIPALAEFPAQAQSSLALQLVDGTVFAHSLTAARDLPGGNGVEIFQGIWVPDNTPAYVVQGLTEHITVEFSNWLRFAYKRAIGA